MARYEIAYDCDDALNCRDIFEGSWSELQEEIKRMREGGYCYNIYAACIDDCDED